MYTILFICLFVCLFIYLVFLGPHPKYTEVPRLGVELEIQLLAYTRATATQDLSHVCDWHHILWQRRILNPMSKARDRTSILRNPGQVCQLLSHNRKSHECDFKVVYTESSSHLQSQVCFRLPTIKTFKKPEIQLPLRSIQFIPLHSLYNLNSPTMLPLSNQSCMQCCSTEQSHVFLHNFYDYSVSVNTISCKFGWKMKSFKKSRLFFHFSFPQFIFIFHFPKREGGKKEQPMNIF